MPRVVAIGLDAAEWGVVSRFIDSGDMPELAKLSGTSARCTMRNVVEYRSELPWTQFLTGRSAAANRYWSTAQFDPSTYEAYEQGAHHSAPFYGRPDQQVISFDVPHSTIDSSVQGAQITAWGAHSPQYPRASSPQGLLSEIDRIFGPHPAFDNDYHGGWFQPAFIESLADRLCEGVERRVDISLWLMDRFPDWDLFLTVFSESHSAGHHFWHGVDPTHPLHGTATSELAETSLRRVFRAIDTALGRLLAHLPEETAATVFSVHGMQANENDVPSLVLLPELLHRAQGGTPRMRGFTRPHSQAPIIPAPERMWASYVRERYAVTRADRARRWVRSTVPAPLLDVKRQVRHRRRGTRPTTGVEFDSVAPPETTMTPEEIKRSYRRSLGWQIPTWYRDRWPSMEYFALPTFSDGKIRLNVRGRERDGIVPLAEYSRAVGAVEQLLDECVGANTGRAAVQDVIHLREHDVMDPDGPDADLVVLWAEPIDALVHPSVGTIGPFPYLRTGEHSSNGFAFVSAPGVLAEDLGERSAFDITPTILDLGGRLDAAATRFEGNSFAPARLTQ